MKKSMCCNENMIYLGKSKKPKYPFEFYIGTYWYCCSKCGKLEWSTYKEKTKYKWYKYDKEKLRKLFEE